MIEDLRIECELLRVKAGMHKRGSCTLLAKALEVNRSNLCMALSGYRAGPREEELLKRLCAYLKTKGSCNITQNAIQEGC